MDEVDVIEASAEGYEEPESHTPSMREYASNVQALLNAGMLTLGSPQAWDDELDRAIAEADELRDRVLQKLKDYAG